MSDRPLSGEANRGSPPRKFTDPGNGWVTPAEKFILTLLGIFVIGGLVFMSWAAVSIDKTKSGIAANGEETAENRAVGCQLLLALGQRLPPSCDEPDVLAYYDPEAIAPPTRNTGLLCAIARQVGVPEQDLPSACNEVDGDA